MPDSSPTRLTISDDGPGPPAVVVVAGELDPHTAPDLAAHLEALVDGGARSVELDLGGLRFMDSSGLRVLLAAAERLAGAGGSLVLRDPAPAVRRLLDIAGVGDALPVRQT